MPLEVRPRDVGTGADYPRSSNGPLRIALVNNMPDSALADTESQFVELLSAASPELPVELMLFSIPTVPRGGQAQERLKEHYSSLPELLCSHFDGVIITGTEPRELNLRKEPYWDELAAVLDWAEEFSYSAILSCLCAHAGVLHSDGILRRRLADKRFGVFAEAKANAHLLTDSVSDPICFPHSRWNDLPVEELIACGYTILTQADEAGAGFFVKQKKESLFVHFQGHPEYGERTLLKEYRRDVRRFLVQERETYPSLPKRYFDERAENLLIEFRKEALSKRNEALMEKFPGNCVAEFLQKTWHSSSVAIFRNWLHFIAGKRAESEGKRVTVQTAGG
jgi:homoserine O-succinyltransferase/O-acetyltransferase